MILAITFTHHFGNLLSLHYLPTTSNNNNNNISCCWLSTVGHSIGKKKKDSHVTHKRKQEREFHFKQLKIILVAVFGIRRQFWFACDRKWTQQKPFTYRTNNGGKTKDKKTSETSKKSNLIMSINKCAILNTYAFLYVHPIATLHMVQKKKELKVGYTDRSNAQLMKKKKLSETFTVGISNDTWKVCIKRNQTVSTIVNA